MADAATIALLSRRHRAAAGAAPVAMAEAPGRVNLIGEHTDYNGGFVLPMAIQHAVRVAASPLPGDELLLTSLDYEQQRRFPLDGLRCESADGWANYPKGVFETLRRAGHRLGGVALTLQGDVPQGAGLSSSAALEVACARALVAVFGLEIDGVELALLAQRAETEFVGVRCGIMDQFISANARAGCALLLDCRNLESRAVPLPADEWVFAITDSAAPRTLAGSAYNRRRAECEAGLRVLQLARPDGRALRDYTAAELAEAAGRLDPVVARRCRHVVEEIERTRLAADDLERGDLVAFGRRMDASHDSLRDLYEVSSPELDWLVSCARRTPGALGARLTGAGFGGCTVALLAVAALPAYQSTLAEYERIFGRTARVFPSRAAPGVHLLDPSSEL